MPYLHTSSQAPPVAAWMSEDAPVLTLSAPDISSSATRPVKYDPGMIFKTFSSKLWMKHRVSANITRWQFLPTKLTSSSAICNDI